MIGAFIKKPRGGRWKKSVGKLATLQNCLLFFRRVQYLFLLASVTLFAMGQTESMIFKAKETFKPPDLGKSKTKYLSISVGELNYFSSTI
jgi:hypothetical protein